MTPEWVLRDREVIPSRVLGFYPFFLEGPTSAASADDPLSVPSVSADEKSRDANFAAEILDKK